MSSEIEELKQYIEMKKSQLESAEREAHAWNAGKYKTSSNAKHSMILTKSIREELSELYSKLKQIQDRDTD